MKNLHRTVKASEMTEGDLMQVGVSTGYVLVADAHADANGRIAVTIYNGDSPNPSPTLFFAPDETVRLSTFAAKEV